MRLCLRGVCTPLPSPVIGVILPLIFHHNLRAPKTQIFVEEHAPRAPRDNTSNSFPPKLKILDRTLSSQNMRGQTAHNRPSSSNPLGEKGDMLYLKRIILGVCSNSYFHCQESHDSIIQTCQVAVFNMQ